MPVKPSTERKPSSRELEPVPFRTTLYKYFVEILISLLIIILLVLLFLLVIKDIPMNNDLFAILLMLLGVFFGRVSKR
jgi:hypothetical protein